MVQVLGPRHVLIQAVPKGPTWKRHVEQLRPRHGVDEDKDPVMLPGPTPTSRKFHFQQLYKQRYNPREDPEVGQEDEETSSSQTYRIRSLQFPDGRRDYSSKPWETLRLARRCCDAILGYKRTGGKTVGGSGKLEFEKDCEFDDIAGEYVLWRY